MVAFTFPKLVSNSLDPAHNLAQQLSRQHFFIHWTYAMTIRSRIRLLDLLTREFEASVLFSDPRGMVVKLWEYQMGYLAGVFGNLLAMVRVIPSDSLSQSIEEWRDSMRDLSVSVDSEPECHRFNRFFEMAINALEGRDSGLSASSPLAALERGPLNVHSFDGTVPSYQSDFPALDQDASEDLDHYINSYDVEGR